MRKFAQIARPVVLAHVSQDLGEEGRFGALEPAGSTFAAATMRLSKGLMSLVPELKKVGRVAGKALIYFLTFSTPALAIGMIADNVVQRPAWLANRVGRSSVSCHCAAAPGCWGLAGHRFRAGRTFIPYPV